jgi:hypothetical protein
MTTQSDDFAPLPTYQESVKSNSTWVVAVITKTQGETITQITTIVPKANRA